MKRAAISFVKLLILIVIIGAIIALWMPGTRDPRLASRRSVCMSNLKQIALALANYEKEHHFLPPAYTTDANGKPLHSWRTLILPYLEEQELYESIDLTKPWNDPANAEALKKTPAVYRCPSAEMGETSTTYLAIVTPNSCLRAKEPRSLSDITDSADKTLMVIEVDAGHAVPWMSPVDADEMLVLEMGTPKAASPHPGGMNAAFVDGRIQFLYDDTSSDARRAMISVDGHDVVAAERTK